MNRRISNKDKKDWENFLSSDEKLPDKDKKSSLKKRYLTNTFDLHGYSLNDANNKIRDLIINSYNKNISKLIIVTGKGLHSKNENNPYISNDFGILKHSVPEYIKNDKELMSMIIEMKDANIEDGGDGAFYIFIKKKL